MRFGPDRRVSAVAGFVAVLCAGYAILGSDPEGRLLLAGAALVLAGYALTDLLYWPRLVIRSDELRVRTPMLRAVVQWSELVSIRVDERSRLGLTARTLEIDAGALLVVYSRRTLGMQPQDAYARIMAYRDVH